MATPNLSSEPITFRWIWIGVCLVCAIPGLGLGQTAAKALAKVESSSRELENAYAEEALRFNKELTALANKCDELKKPDLAKFTRSQILDRDPSREYFFVLTADQTLRFPPADDRIGKYWKENLEKKYNEHANELFGLAKKAHEQDRHELSFRWLNECLVYSPENPEVARILEFDKTESKIKVNAYRRQEKLLPAGEINKLESDHFQLFTNIDEADARQALIRFERWHRVWRQMFYDYWAHPTWLSRRFDPDSDSGRRKKKFKVVLYRDRDEYVSTLRPVSPGIEVSTGYYLFPEKTSFFYAGDNADETTWVHELTHQFMHETIPISTRAERGSSLWAIEGIAMYMESICDFGSHLTLGGEDSERLNYCRYNYFRRGFFVDMNTLNGMTRDEFIKSREIKGLYSLSAGYCHYLLRHTSAKLDFLKFLQMIHQGKKASVFFERVAEKVSLDEGFKGFLQPTRDKVLASLIRPQGYRILYLGNSGFDDQSLAGFAKFSGLETLDLSGNPITNDGIQCLPQMKGLQYLSLEKTAVTDQGMATVGKLSSLEELDLTTTAITDLGIEKLKNSSSLIALWLAGTRVSDDSIDHLLGLDGLKQLDIRKTKISAEGKKRLNTKLQLVD